MKRRTILIYLLLLSLVLGGIVFAMSKFKDSGPRKVNIHGTITHGGNPIQWKTENWHFVVVFVPEPRNMTTDLYPATKADPGTGRYEIEGIPTGKYKVQIALNDPDHRYDLRDMMVYDPSSTPPEYEVTHDGQEINIDLSELLAKRRTPEAEMPRRPADDAPPRNEPKAGDHPKSTK
jgi:hypothetical protein